MVRVILGVVVLVVLSGCGSTSRPGAQADFRKATAGSSVDASVLIIGDELVTYWVTPEILSAHPMWTAAGSPIGTQETTNSIAARLPALLASKHYDVVVVLAGLFDMTDPMWDYPCGDMTYQTCNNLDAMAEAAHQAGAKVIFCTIPETLGGSAGDAIINANEYLPADEGEFNRIMDLGYTQTEDSVADIEAVVAGTAWTDDGLTFNALGAQEATTAAQGTIAELKGNWGAK